MTLLKDKVAIVTGASSGIGLATARLFAQQGAKVIVSARRGNALNILVDEIEKSGGQAKAVAGDVTSESYNQELVDVAVAEYGRLDIAFNNAGTIGKLSPIVEQSLEDWEFTHRTNLTSGFLAAKAQIPAMLEHGCSIIFTSSFVGYTTGMPNMAAYAAAKAGLIGFCKSLAAEYGPQKIRVNSLLPGGTATPMAAEFGDDPDTVEFVKNLHALKRMAKPEEIAQSALYLASDLSSFTTGTALLADGGVSINKT